MDPLRIAVVGPGRAGGAVALRAIASGHRLEAVVPGPSGSVPASLTDSVQVVADGPLPPVDLVIISVPDDVIAEVADRLVDRVSPSQRVDRHPSLGSHVGGRTWRRSRSRDGSLGGVHPLMTLPSPEAGSGALVGAPAGVSGSTVETVGRLVDFAATLGMRPFTLDDGMRALYHTAASVAANMVTAVLGVSFDLFDAAGIDPAVSRPLVERAVANCFELGPGPALTGPVSRGDVGTIALQRAAVADLGPALVGEFDSLLDLVRARAASGGSA